MDKIKKYEIELRQKGLRITRQRKIIMEILSAAKDHPNALEIFQKAHKIEPSISLSTVYRTMKALEKEGSIQRHAFHGGPSRFEHAKGEHHDHLIDIESGQNIEFRSDIIEKIQEEVARALGYEIVHHRLELYGKKKQS